jgi:hypothetical protein
MEISRERNSPKGHFAELIELRTPTEDPDAQTITAEAGKPAPGTTEDTVQSNSAHALTTIAPSVGTPGLSSSKASGIIDSDSPEQSSLKQDQNSQPDVAATENTPSTLNQSVDISRDTAESSIRRAERVHAAVQRFLNRSKGKNRASLVHRASTGSSSIGQGDTKSNISSGVDSVRNSIAKSSIFTERGSFSTNTSLSESSRQPLESLSYNENKFVEITSSKLFPPENNIYTAKPWELKPSPSLRAKWMEEVKPNLERDLLPILHNLPQSLSPQESMIHLEFCMVGVANGSSHTVELKPAVCIRCTSKKCRNSIRKAVSELTWIHNFSQGPVQVRLSTIRLSGGGEIVYKSEYMDLPDSDDGFKVLVKI